MYKLYVIGNTQFAAFVVNPEEAVIFTSAGLVDDQYY
jgi:hypothetical protein